jgi:hydroxyethylthiazole kinase-like uncharacterized protein yjeF
VDERLHADGFWGRLRSALDQVPEEARTPPAGARVGAVLVLLEETAAGPTVVLTRRRRDLRSHPGQISFPGGRLDPGETIQGAALREAEEEVGLRPDSVEVVGIGPTFYIPPSRFWVVPVLGRWRDPHPLAENPWEVDEVLHVPLAQLLDRDRWRHAPLSDRGSSWAWQLDDDLLWGATAIVMALLLDVAVEGWDQGVHPEQLGEELAVRPWETAPAWIRQARLDGDLPTVDQDELAHVSASQVRSARAWLDARGVDGRARAEQAGRALAHAVRRLSGGEVAGLSVTVLAGASDNGAGGLVAARLLTAAGGRVHVIAVGAPRYPDQVRVLRDAGVAVEAVAAARLTDVRSPGEVVIAAMLGIGADPPLRDLPEIAATWLRRHDVPVVAAELPSGLSADIGLKGPCVTADVTIAFGLPTLGVRPAIAHPYVGDLYVADLGIPEAAWQAAGVGPPGGSLFGRGPLVRLTADARATDAGTPDQGEVLRS